MSPSPKVMTPFGNVLASFGPATSNYGFAGEEQDSESGHLFLRARTYNPETGRFLQQDSVLGLTGVPQTLHRYTYAFNNPINYTDPSGQMPDLGGATGPIDGGGGLGGAFGAVERVAGAFISNAARSATALSPFLFNNGSQQNEGHRPFLCGVADFVGGVADWVLNNPETAIGIAIIGAAIFFTGGAAIPAILIGAGIGAAFGAGFSVYQNTQNGMSFGEALQNIDWSLVGYAAFQGAVAGAAGALVGPLLPAGGSGLTRVATSVFAEVVQGRVSQVAVNLASGQPWHQDLWSPQDPLWWLDIGLDVVPGAGAAMFDNWRAARAAGRAANAAADARRSVDTNVNTSQAGNNISASQTNNTPTRSVNNNSTTPHPRDTTSPFQCPANSFTADTMVATEDGLVPIEEIQVGDKVLAEDPETGEQGFYEVVSLTTHPAQAILEVIIETTDDNNKADSDNNTSEAATSSETSEDETDQTGNSQAVMHVTAGHPIYVEGKGWLDAENLQVGERLRRADGGMAKVLSIEQKHLDEPQAVYNFTVAGVHTYFVLDAKLLVHNVKKCDPRKYAPALESGYPRGLQDDIIDALDDDGGIAIRPRPYRAAGLEAKYPPKEMWGQGLDGCQET